MPLLWVQQALLWGQWEGGGRGRGAHPHQYQNLDFEEKENSQRLNPPLPRTPLPSPSNVPLAQRNQPQPPNHETQVERDLQDAACVSLRASLIVPETTDGNCECKHVNTAGAERERAWRSRGLLCSRRAGEGLEEPRSSLQQASAAETLRAQSVEAYQKR